MFGGVHGDVGGAQEVVGVGEFGAGDRNTDAGRDGDSAAVERGGLGEGRDDAVGDGLEGGGAGDVPAEDGEFVAGETGDGVVRADGVLEPGRDCAQELVAGVVAEGVVDGFEAVEVDEQDADAGAG